MGAEGFKDAAGKQNRHLLIRVLVAEGGSPLFGQYLTKTKVQTLKLHPFKMGSIPVLDYECFDLESCAVAHDRVIKIQG